MFIFQDNESARSSEISILKLQAQELKDLNVSVSDAERKGENIREEYEIKILERDRKVSDLQDQKQDLENRSNELQNQLTAKDTKISDLEYQIGKYVSVVSSLVDSTVNCGEECVR